MMGRLLHWCRKLARRIGSCLTALLILTAFVVTILYLAGIRPYVVTTGSMEPAIPVRSLCFVNEHIPLEEVAAGEVISFRLGDDLLVTHRVTGICGGSYFTKGDANPVPDAAPVTSDNYIGKTVAVIPRLGTILLLLHSRPGQITAAGLIAFLLLWSWIPGKNAAPAGKKGGDDENANTT